MEIDSLSKSVSFVSSTITSLIKLKDLNLLEDIKHDAEQKLEESEKNIEIAEVEIA